MIQPNRLFRQDWRSAANVVRASFSGWHDRAIAAVILLVALAAIRSWFADRPFAVATWSAAAIGGAVGIGVGRSIAGRLAFHATDGVLAIDALRPASRRGYAIRWHGIALLSLASTLLVAGPALLAITVAGYMAGALVAPAIAALPERRRGRWRTGWALRGIAVRVVAGIAMACAVLLLLVLARTLDAPARLAATGMVVLIATGLLTIVDDGIVRFMTITGHATRCIVARHLRATAGFAGVAVPGSAIVAGPLAAAIVGAGVAAMTMLLILRVLAYRLHRKRFADLVVAIVVGLLLTVAFAMPVALPVVVIMLFWQLQRRAARRRWLLI